MKTFLVIAMVLGVAGEARAQDEIAAAAAVLDASVGVLGVVYGSGSSHMLYNDKRSVHWFAGSYTSAALNLALGAAWLGLAADTATGNGNAIALAVAHLAVGLWNAIVPTVALITPASPGVPRPSMAPVMITGRGASGKRFSGLGVQFINF